MKLINIIKSHKYYGAKLRVLLKIIDTDSQSIIIISACVAHSYCQITKHQVAWQFKVSQIQTYSWLISFSYAIVLLLFLLIAGARYDLMMSPRSSSESMFSEWMHRPTFLYIFTFAATHYFIYPYSISQNLMAALLKNIWWTLAAMTKYGQI